MPSTNDPIKSTTRTVSNCEASAAALLRRASVENSLLRRELVHCESHAEYGSLSQAGRRVLAALLPPARGVESEARKLREELLQAQETAAALLEQVHAAQRAPEGDGPLARAELDGVERELERGQHWHPVIGVGGARARAAARRVGGGRWRSRTGGGDRAARYCGRARLVSCATATSHRPARPRLSACEWRGSAGCSSTVGCGCSGTHTSRLSASYAECRRRVGLHTSSLSR